MRNITALELFILTAIDISADTVYSLREWLGLSPGGIKPVLAQLESSGFLHRSPEGGRGARRFVVTEKGRQLLKEGWHRHFADRSLEMEAVLRLAWSIAVRDPRNAYSYLVLAREMRKYEAAEEDRKAQHQQLHLHRGNSFDLYRWMRTLSSAKRLAAEAEAMQAIGAQLHRMAGMTDEPTKDTAYPFHRKVKALMETQTKKGRWRPTRKPKA